MTLSPKIEPNSENKTRLSSPNAQKESDMAWGAKIQNQSIPVLPIQMELTSPATSMLLHEQNSL